MAEYKCINCGAKRESEVPCSCSFCGYRAYEGDYDRASKLKEEILSFVSKLRPDTKKNMLIPDLLEKEADINGKNKSVSRAEIENRFPDIKKISNFVRNVDRTEKFVKRSEHTVEEIKGYITTYYTKTYIVSYDCIYSQIKKYDEVLNKALQILSVEIKPENVFFPSADVKYEDVPNETLLPAVGELTEALISLCEKFKTFIKVNNLYGDAYKKIDCSDYKVPDYNNYDDNLRKVICNVKKVLDKRYVVDLFDDGYKEIREMLSEYWRAVKTLLAGQILSSKYSYIDGNGEVFSEPEFINMIADLIGRRYAALDSMLSTNDPLTNKTEEELFYIYNQMIEIDSIGIMGINKSRLVKIGEREKQLEELIGLSEIKESIQKIKAYAIANRESDILNVHMCFNGNPGTGKTEVARIIAGILYENRILPTDKVVEVDRSGLVGQYVGETPIKTLEKIEQAMGGVLFIDEAYALVPKDAGFDYGNEAIATLLKAMEDYRGKFCVILAGYKNQMADMIASNPGFKSRIQFELDFPNYSREELGQITSLMLEKRKYSMTDTAMSKILDITDVKRKEPNFANAREIRNILDQVIMCQNLRAGNSEDKEIGIVDVNKYITDAHINLPTSGEGMAQKILTAEEELDALIGLDSVKRMVKKIRAYAKRNKDDENFNVHMCFYGNPGTGKTEVARILSRILYDAGVLPEAKLIETDAHGLIGKYVGETAPKTEAKIADAMGGVLFIDEAYSLIDSASSSGTMSNYGEEAIAVLLKKMEDSRGRFGVILAGYQTEMKNMLSSNPGLESRIQFTLEFPDYTREELGEIAVRFASKKKYVLENAALERILDVAEYYRGKPNFANARTIRNILDQVIMNQNLRAEDDIEDNTIILQDVEDYISDEKIMQKTSSERRIGFY